VPGERRGHVKPHLRIGPEVVREVGKPVAHRILHAVVAEARADDDQPGARRDVANLRAREPVRDRGQHARGRHVVGNVELHAAPRRDPLVAAATEHRDPVLDQLAVGNDDGLAAVRRDRCIAPADADDLSRDALHPDPVADAARVVELQRDTAPQVAESLLQRECDDAGDHRRGRDDAGEVHADDLHPDEREHDQHHGDQDVRQDPRDREAPEHALEQAHERDPREADRDEEEQRLADHEGDGRVGQRGSVAREDEQAHEPDAHRDRHVDHVAAQVAAEPQRDQREGEPGRDEHLGVEDQVGRRHAVREGEGASAADYIECVLRLSVALRPAPCPLPAPAARSSSRTSSPRA